MSFTLIVCTYQRAETLLCLLNSVKMQSMYPDAILIIDGSTDNTTEKLLNENIFSKLTYYKVNPEDRGLTKQRNIGVGLVSPDTDIVCFLDDDTVLEPDYFEQLVGTYEMYPEAVAVGGYINNEVQWELSNNDNSDQFCYDGWCRSLPLKFKLRRLFGLSPETLPGKMSTFSHSYSISFLPPSGKIYEVDFIMGGVSSYRMEVFKKFQFSEYFIGYGLYEDLDFSIRVSRLGTIYLNTAARLGHYHDASGRPNMFKYGTMVIRNGWYVLRLKFPHPGVKASTKWYAVHLLLILIRIGNIFTTKTSKQALTDVLGRIWGLGTLIINKPKVI
jgi:glycosyltransferase involved in cell wall biosynthesis